MGDLARLIRIRGGIKHSLTSFKTFVSKITKDTALQDKDFEELRERVARIEALFHDFCSCQTDIETNCEDNMVEQQYIERENFESEYFSAISKAKAIVNSYFESNSVHNNSQNGSVANSSQHSLTNRADGTSHIKLPEIKLIKFSGSYENWMEFRDTFISLIDSNPSINNIQKFHYLRSSLEGQAAQIIRNLEISESNYDVAIKLLHERYDNKRLLINNHVKALFNLPIIKAESSIELRKLVDDFSKHLLALEALGEPVEQWSSLLIHLITTKLDSATKREWEASRLDEKETATNEDLKQFLKSRCELFETLDQSKKQSHSSNKNFNSSGKPTVAFVTTNYKQKCNYCENTDHSIYNCEKFLNLSVTNRSIATKNKKLCTNCLKKGHFNANCKSISCKQCEKRHHSLLHLDNFNTENRKPDSTPETTVAHCNEIKNHKTLLSTAIIQVTNSKGENVYARALLDSGSESCFITKEFCDKLKLKTNKVNIKVSGINQIESKIKFSTKIRIQSCNSDYSTSFNCFVIDSIAGKIKNDLDISQCSIPDHILSKLAENNKLENNQIQILIGANLFWDLLCNEQIKLGQNQPVVQKTLLGWIIAGPFATCHSQSKSVSCHFVTNLEIQNQLKSFWELEACEERTDFTNEENYCEKHFQDTIKRNDEGRFIVSIPFKNQNFELGDSSSTAIKRFQNLEQKFRKNDKLKQDYVAFMNEYKNLSHMTKVEPKEHDEKTYYIPHHAVLKETSTTTKLRVVFNASCKTSNNVSLNDVQCVGPVIQDDLWNILLRFRIHKIVLSADVEKMYRQILIAPNERDLQRIVWRDDNTRPVEHFVLNTVTYGTAAAPYLAIRCLQQTARDYANQFPEASQVILKDFYVDDLLTGTDSIQDAIRLQQEITFILKTGCFPLRKWISNCTEVLKEISDVETVANSVPVGGTEVKRTLGLLWIPSMDHLTFEFNGINSKQQTTKREMLSAISKLFDPLGLIGPCMVIAKIMLQELWIHGYHWDQTLPETISSKWISYVQELVLLNKLTIPRWTLSLNRTQVELHVFSDASQTAYGSCAYVRVIQEDNSIKVNLFCSKSRVAPIKKQSIPRLELCGAVLSSKLVSKITTSLDKIFDKICYWCDSTIVLSWINMQSEQLKPFVAHRVKEIQERTDRQCWFYVNTADNPADAVSRGVSPKKLVDNNLWWKGPHWLSLPQSEWPTNPIQYEETIPEVKPVTKNVFITQCEADTFPFHYSSSLTTLVRITAWCLRFKDNCKLAHNNRRSGNLSSIELNNAMNVLVKLSQAESFQDILISLENDDNCDKFTNETKLKSKCRLVHLSPFLDSNGIIRVGGRLKHSNFSYNKKHPALLFGKHILSRLIMENEHKRSLHGGPQLMLSFVRERFWPTNGKNLANSVYHKCIQCFKTKPKEINQMMGNLPQSRLVAMYPFYATGIDYAGPFLVRPRAGRGVKPTKFYVCLFICMTVKAIHLEYVSSLKTEDFLSTFHRFIARRGLPSHVYSDNGTNFVGAASKLNELGKFLIKNKDHITNVTSNEGVQWHFIPASSPHFGGLWEAGVKATKFHLRRVMGNSILTQEEFSTVLTQIESVLNSRPLHPLSTSPDDLEPLTPSHFLLGRSGSRLPDVDILDVPMNRLSRFQYQQRLVQCFWKRWSTTYISELQQRLKWGRQNSNVKLGDLVLIKEDNLPPLKWKLGRICSLHPGDDQLVRVVSVKISNGIIKRAITKVCPLPLASSSGESEV